MMGWINELGSGRMGLGGGQQTTGMGRWGSLPNACSGRLRTHIHCAPTSSIGLLLRNKNTLLAER